MAQLRRLRERFHNELVIIGVHSAKFPSEHLTANIRQAVLREGIQHPVVNDTGFRIWSEYNVRAWPTLVLIDPRGRIAGVKAGEIQAEDFIPIIEQIVLENQSEISQAPFTWQNKAQPQPDRPLSFPSHLLLARNGMMWIADSGHHRIIEIQLDHNGTGGEVLRVFGSGQPGLQDGPAGQAQFHNPHGLAITGSPQNGSLYVADTGNHAIRVINLESGDVRRIAGSGMKAHGTFALGDPMETPLRSPWALIFLEETLFIAMAGSHQIWVLTPDGRLGPFAGTGQEALVDGPVAQTSFNQPSDLALDSGRLFVADPEASAIRSISLDSNPTVSTLIGEGLFEFGDRDGIGSAVRLQHPAGIAYADRLIYIADTYNNKIKILDPLTRRVRTLIGSGKPGHQDGGFGQARLYEPEGVQVSAGKVYIADTNNHQVRVAGLDSHQVSTFQLRNIERLQVIAEQANNRIRLDPQVVKPGNVYASLDIQLPAGYKLNPDAETRLKLENRAEPFYFKANQPVSFDLQIEQDCEVTLDLSVIFCVSGDQNLCLIDNHKLVLPLVVQMNAPNKIKISYPIPRPVNQ